jgi:hypothetical protein
MNVPMVEKWLADKLREERDAARANAEKAFRERGTARNVLADLLAVCEEEWEFQPRLRDCDVMKAAREEAAKP